MKKIIFYSLTATVILLTACKKEFLTSTKTTREKIEGRWSFQTLVHADYHSGSSNTSTYAGALYDYVEFGHDGIIYSSMYGWDTQPYGLITGSTLWVEAFYNLFELKVLTNSELQLYRKIPGLYATDYSEDYFYFTR